MSRSQPRNFFDAMRAPSRSTLSFSQTIEGWIRLAVFAVVDDVDTDLGLLTHDFADCLAQPCGVAGLTESLGTAVLHEIAQFGGRGGPPACVVRIRSVLCCIAAQSSVTCAEVMTLRQRSTSSSK